MTLAQGRKYDSPESIKEISSFAAFHKLNLDEVLEPLDSFSCFNEFFYRKLKPGSRPVAFPDQPEVCVSPADARCLVFQNLEQARTIWIKGEEFTLGRLFGDEDLAREFTDGSMYIFRLAPQDYHRFHVPCDGVFHSPRKIEGAYYTVNPMAVRSALDVYGENARVISVMDTDRFGPIVYACIGAMLVKVGLYINNDRCKQLGGICTINQRTHPTIPTWR